MPGPDPQRIRAITQIGFFVLFIVAPPLDLFRYDLNLGHFIILGYQWRLHLTASDPAMNVLLLGLLPVVIFVVVFLYVAWRWGRLYCGWLCPHFSVVEFINALMIKAIGKPSLWDKKPLPGRHAAAGPGNSAIGYKLAVLISAVAFALLWSISLLTYLLPPFEIYSNLANGSLTGNQILFLLVATSLLSIEFLFARHLFCRFGCAVGLFQSLGWMSNRGAMLVNFDSARAILCQQCDNACDSACPMRLHPRSAKRKMFTCTQCGECISACKDAQGGDIEQSLLRWMDGDAALKQSEPPVSGR